MTWRRVLSGCAAVLVSGLAVTACDDGSASQETAPIPVRVMTVESHALTRDLRYSATIEPNKSVNLAFQVSGYVTAITQKTGADGKPRDIQTGDPVTRGALLAVVDEKPYRDKVEGAKAQLAEATAKQQKADADFKRASILFKEQSMTAPEFDTYKKEYQTAHAAVAGAKSQLDAAEEDLQHCRLTAPLDGTILQRNIEVGGLASPGLVGFVVADISAVKAVFGVPSVVLADVKQGNPMTITTESVRGRDFKGTITAIAAAADSTTRVFDVEITVPNPDGLLKPGMVASLALPKASEKKIHASGAAVIVPIAAIVRSRTDPEGYAVFVADGTGDSATVKHQDVTVGRILGNTVDVTGGLKPGTRIVVRGATLVNDGETVRIIP
jgi:RND family efflux transporter MFP subunit